MIAGFSRLTDKLPAAGAVARLVATTDAVCPDRTVGVQVDVGGSGDGVRVGMGVEVGTSLPPPITVEVTNPEAVGAGPIGAGVSVGTPATVG